MHVTHRSEFGIGSLSGGNFSIRRTVSCVKTHGSAPSATAATALPGE